MISRAGEALGTEVSTPPHAYCSFLDRVAPTCFLFDAVHCRCQLFLIEFESRVLERSAGHLTLGETVDMGQCCPDPGPLVSQGSLGDVQRCLVSFSGAAGPSLQCLFSEP